MHPQELAVAIEHLDAAVVAVGDVDVVLAVDADVVRRVELAGILVRVRARRCPREPHDFTQFPCLSNLATREFV